MAEDKSTDILMMMVLKGQPVRASCQTQFDVTSKAFGDSLIKDFQPGCFFEISDLDLGLTAPAPDQQKTAKDGTGGVQVGNITITRQIDIASMVLMQCCIGTVGFDTASIVKRRATGGSKESGQAYLRVNLDGVLITNIDWTDQHVVKEKLTLITRGLEVIYRPQNADGSLGAKTMQTSFTVPVSAKPAG